MKKGLIAIAFLALSVGWADAQCSSGSCAVGRGRVVSRARSVVRQAPVRNLFHRVFKGRCR